MAEISENPTSDDAPPRTLFLGDWGSWKTSFLMTYGAGLAVLDFDGGAKVRNFLNDKHTPARRACTVVNCDVNAPLAGELKSVEIARSWVSKNRKNPEITACLIDSVTSLVTSAWQTHSGSALSDWTSIRLGNQDTFNLFFDLRQTGWALFLTGHTLLEEWDEEVKEASKWRTIHRQRIDWKIKGREVPAYVPMRLDDVWYSAELGGKRFLQTKPGGLVRFAKSRHCLPDMTFKLEDGIKPVLEAMQWPRKAR